MTIAVSLANWPDTCDALDTSFWPIVPLCDTTAVARRYYHTFRRKKLRPEGLFWDEYRALFRPQALESPFTARSRELIRLKQGRAPP